ncbi:hypothetical protein K432DRAFT_330298 [Lepidopterella palustris CBS 459.81]|uniref:LIM zinc-binding domain-containing protein n=1 Tax=Lepidopterella palustris CBS 459.81 TaxID=1314670 RepID=A0A8E2E915_9PEZI|nr:hypothetical protein K432DRAFT_330298 [Lepidopterella palustris CBS 459.81]
MAGTTRPASFLPAIKCSDCGMEIEIVKMADHVCSNTSSRMPVNILSANAELRVNIETSQQASPQSKLDRSATFSAGVPSKSTGLLKPGRMPPPPRIDSSMANQPFIPRDQSTPMSNYSDSKSLSSLSPNSAPRSPYKITRSATSPMPRLFSQPSPDLPGNMDCAFPPFPTARSATPTETRSKPKDKLELSYNHRYAEADPLFAPLSPRTNGGQSVLKRMNTIAPGPFDTRGGKSLERSTSAGRTAVDSRHKRSATQSSSGSTKGHSQRPSTAGSERSRHSVQSDENAGLSSRSKPGPPARPARPDEGIDAFLERLQEQANEPLRDSLNQENRSRTFPLRKESRDAVDTPPLPLSRRPSEPSNMKRRPSNTLETAMVSETTTFDGLPNNSGSGNTFPLRGTSRSGSRAGTHLDDVPPVPAIPSIQRDVPGKPLHTPSDSGSSDDSVSSSDIRSAASSRSSPPASEAGLSRRPSKASAFEPPTEDSIPRSSSPEPIQSTVSEVKTSLPRSITPQKRNESNNGTIGFNRGNAPEPLLPPRKFSIPDAPESPMDPAIQRGLFSQRRSSNTPLKSNPTPSITLSKSPPKETSSSLAPRAPSPAVKRRGTTASKGKCRGCSEPIVGKSVKAADGRLTGRYHKQCFVCKTCRAPFQTADFYVINNFPYCEQHYHQLNGSLCKTCDKGIEGQYLETDRQQKFHPNCFTCQHCRIQLRDDYFEVGGKVFCERHGYYAAQQNTFLGPGRKNPERRTTKLMMMS